MKKLSFVSAISGCSLLVFLLVLTASFSAASAQTVSSIAGTVTDQSGGVLPGVEVTVRNVDTARARSVITDDQGRYTVTNLGLGKYEVSAKLSGFQEAVRKGVSVTLDRQVVVDIEMSVGEITQQVVVSGEAPLVDASSSQIANLVEQAQIDTLPLNGRSFSDLVLLDSSVTHFRNALSTAGTGTAFGGTGVRLVVAGLRPELGNILIDGTDAIDAFGNAPGSAAGVLLGVDTIREFEVLSSNYSAEFGRSAGGTINTVTKSGTNEFHGSAFEFLRNDNLDARNFFDGEQPEFKRNQFGFTAGGPIVKDRTFFFASYEGLRDRLGVTKRPKTINESARIGNLPGGQVAVNPKTVPFLDLFPLPNGRDFGDGTGEFVFTTTIPTSEDFFVVKVDHQFSEKHSLFVRYSFDDAETDFAPTGLPPARLGRDSRQQLATVGYSAVITDRLVNTARFGYNRSAQIVPAQPFPGIRPELSFFTGDSRGVGTINIRGVVTAGGLGSIGSTIPNQFQVNDDLIYSLGRHNVKFGFLAKRFQYDDDRTFQVGGQFTFVGLPNFLKGVADTFVGDLPTTKYRTDQRFSVFGGYVQDDVKVTPQFTLNLGVHYEFMTTPFNESGPVQNFIDPFTEAVPAVLSKKPFLNPGKRNFAPRIGFAWDPTGSGKTAIRGGFGLFFQQLNEANFNFVFRLSQNSDLSKTQTLIIGGPPARGAFPKVTPPNPFRASIVFPLEYNAKMPYTAQWNFSIQRELSPGFVAQVAYLGNRGINLSRPTEINFRRREIVNGKAFFPPGPPGPRENPNFLAINLRDFGGDSYYHGLTSSLRKRFSQGYQFQVSYTVSKTIDNTPPILRDNENSPTILFDYQQPNLDKSLSGFDVRQNFVGNFTWELPIGPGKAWGSDVTGVAGRFIEGWQVNGIVSLASGNPFTVVNSFDQARTRAIGPFRHDRPDLKPGADNNPVLGGPDRYFDVGAFQLETAGFLGDLGRNTLEGPGLATVDLSFFKNTSLSEAAKLQFRFELFNIFNRANFSTPEGPNRTAFLSGDAVGGPVGGLVNGSAGRLTSTVTSARQIQFALKLIF